MNPESNSISSVTGLNSFQVLLKRFIDQSNASGLSRKEYPKFFEGLGVRLGFGFGNPSRFPWIAFVAEGENPQGGIYPVYLYYKEFNTLILAYGVSETSPPKRQWNIPLGVETVGKYFEHRKILVEKYTQSYVFKDYDTSAAMPWEEMRSDFASMIDEYKKLLAVD